MNAVFLVREHPDQESSFYRRVDSRIGEPRTVLGLIWSSGDRNHVPAGFVFWHLHRPWHRNGGSTGIVLHRWHLRCNHFAECITTKNRRPPSLTQEPRFATQISLRRSDRDRWAAAPRHTKAKSSSAWDDPAHVVPPRIGPRANWLGRRWPRTTALRVWITAAGSR